jgi:hypothetical protein
MSTAIAASAATTAIQPAFDERRDARAGAGGGGAGRDSRIFETALSSAAAVAADS